MLFLREGRTKQNGGMLLRKQTLIGISYGFVHFSVEVASFYLLFSRVSTSPYWWAFALLFDALAFIPQGILGILTDKYPKCNIGVIGSLLMILALLIPNGVLGLVVIALGNACIHISGAQHTLRDSQGKSTPNAIFIGGGSFGVITGQLLASFASIGILMIPLLLMTLSLVIQFFIHKTHPLEGEPAQFDIAANRSTVTIALLAFVGVVVRGYTAYAIPSEWNKTVPQAVALFVCMGIGKILGGVFSDRFGFRKVTLISLLGGLPFLLFGNSNMALSLTGVALFSMTMPVTVSILASRFPHRPGFAFGITTIGLFVGSAPAFFIRPESLLAHQLVVIALTAVALPAISICIKKGK